MIKTVSIFRVAVYTVFVFIATIILQIYTPATRGYFNLGEVAIYSIAYIATPLVAGVSAGVGSALADLVTGYGIFAPGTLIIKFGEGFIVSYLIRYFSRLRITQLKILSVIVAILTGALISFTGIVLWTGSVELSSVPINLFGYQATLLTASFDLAAYIWVLIGVVVIAIMIYTIIIRGSENISAALSMSIGGLEMVMGYLLYEYFVSNPLQGIVSQAAFAEVPVNMGQMIFGLTIALSVIGFLRRALK
ncbi:MAG: ECF transporter S component [Sulfolobales archaeon]